jgi:heterotetrameric sarcosine oxidase gamma subunit
LLETRSELMPESPLWHVLQEGGPSLDPGGMEKVLSEAVGIADASHLGALLVRGPHSAETLEAILGARCDRIGDVAVVDGIAFGRRRMDEFEIMAPSPEAASALRDQIQSRPRIHLISALNISHGRAGIFAGGILAGEALMKLCALNLSHSHFPDRRMAQASVAKVRASIMRCDKGGLPVFYLGTVRSLGPYLWGQLAGVVSELDGHIARDGEARWFRGWPAEGNGFD